MIRRLLALAWPVVLARLGIMGMGVVDVMVVGQFAPAELPYQALGWSPVNVLTVSGIGLLTGVQVLAARALGAGKPTEAGGAWQRGVTVSMVFGAGLIALVWLLDARLFTAFGIAPRLAVPALRVTRILVFSLPLQLLYVSCAQFLEAIQRPMAATITMWGANAVNLLLNLLLVPKWGAVGSAYCTLGARAFLGLVLTAWVLSLDDRERFGIRARSTEPTYAALLGVGGAALVSHAAEAGAFSCMTLIAGRLGGEAVAAYQILLNLLAVVFMVSLGFSSATAVLTAEAVGRRLPRDAVRAGVTGLSLNTSCLIVIALGMLGFSRFIGRAYTANLSLAAEVSGLLWLVAVIIPPDGAQVVAAAALRARGDNWFPTGSHLFAYALVMPALAFWLAEGRGQAVTGLMLAILISSLLSCAGTCFRLWQLRFDTRPDESASG